MEASRIACWGYTISGESLRLKDHLGDTRGGHLGRHARWSGLAGILKYHYRHHHQPYSINYFQTLFSHAINRLWRYIATCADVS